MSALLLVAMMTVAAEPEVTLTPEASFDQARDCARWRAEGLGEGPIALGYAEADLATGRRACPRTELGIGGRFGAIIDTPDFYGALAAQGTVFGSYALRDTTELFGMLEVVSFAFAQNAVLTSTNVTLGHLTGGVTQVLFRGDTVVAGVTGRVLLPTSFEIPGARLLGGELGANLSWRPTRWFEGHASVGGTLTGAVGRGPALVRGGAIVLAGAQLSPFDWGALVIDLSGRLGPVSSLAPSFALRFKIARLGIELAGTLPLVGTDRHDFIAGLRLNWRL